MILTLLLALGVLLILFLICKKNGDILQEIPGPPGFSILGNIPDLFLQTPESLFETMRVFSKKYPIYRLSLGPVDIINMSNVGDIEQVLTSYKHLSKSRLYSYLTPWLGTGLLTSTGEKWHFRRKLLTPAFHFNILQKYLVIFIEETDKIIQELMTRTDEPCIDVMPLVTQFTLQTIGETSMGFQNVEETKLRKYRNDVKHIGEIIIYRLMRPWYDSNFIYSLSSTGREQKRVIKELHDFSNCVIRQRETFLRYNQDSTSKPAMLDILLESKDNGEKIDYDGIREEVDTFMFEGHDTTSSAIAMILLQLANNPHIQKKASREIENVMGSDHCSYKNLKSLTYLENCIKEGLRLYPSVPLISRFAGEDYVTTTGYKIPEGTTLHLHIYDLHRNPDVFTNPEKFDPDRFTLKKKGMNPYSYIPFSAGPRNCIGQKFAMLEMKTFFCSVLKNFILEAVDKVGDVKFQSDLVLKTSKPIRIKFIKK